MSYGAPIHGLDSNAVPAQSESIRPRVVVLCGSMRFQDVMSEVAVTESLAGRIVIPPLVNMNHRDDRWATKDQADRIKIQLYALHRAKIDRADEVIVVNPGGYIGDSTRGEIAYAEALGLPIRYLEPPAERMSIPQAIAVLGGADHLRRELDKFRASYADDGGSNA